jgi:hypothetical protein
LEKAPVKILGSYLFCLYPIILPAQDDFKAGTRFGAKIGIVTSQLSGDNYWKFKEKGFTGGAYLRIRLSKKLLAQVELLFVQKGNRQTSGIRPYSQANSVNLWYTEFPLLLQFPYKKWTVEAGPGFGFLLMQEETEQINGISYLKPRTPFKGREFSFNAGLQYAFTTFFAINLRYSNSLWPVRQLPVHSGWLNGKQLNNVLALTLCGSLKQKTGHTVRSQDH